MGQRLDTALVIICEVFVLLECGGLEALMYVMMSP